MKYLIIGSGSILGNGNSVYGYVTTLENAVRLCNSLNEKSNGGSNYYFEKIEESSPLYNMPRICLDYMV